MVFLRGRGSPHGLVTSPKLKILIRSILHYNQLLIFFSDVQKLNMVRATFFCWLKICFFQLPNSRMKIWEEFWTCTSGRPCFYQHSTSKWRLTLCRLPSPMLSQFSWNKSWQNFAEKRRKWTSFAKGSFPTCPVSVVNTAYFLLHYSECLKSGQVRFSDNYNKSGLWTLRISGSA